MATSEKFCLRWNDFESNISVAFRELRDDKDFFDVTLACDENQIQAHKVILSACSPFFRTVLKRNKHDHPLLYLKGVKYSDIVAVLNFMYHGEVNVAQEELNSFLAVAEDLKIKGLTQNDSEKGKDTQNKTNSAPKQRPRQAPEQVEIKPPPRLHLNQHGHNPPPKQARPVTQATIIPNFTASDDNIEEIAPIKAEPISIAHDTSTIVENTDENYSDNTAGMIVPETSMDASVYNDEYSDYANYEAEYEVAGTAQGEVGNVEGNKGECSQFMSQIETNPDNLTRSSLSWSCHLCSKLYVSKNAMEDHIRGAHLGTLSAFECKFCGKPFQSRNSRSGHMSKLHKIEMGKQ